MSSLGDDVIYKGLSMVIVGRTTIGTTITYTLEDEDGEKYYGVSDSEIKNSEAEEDDN